MLQGWNASGSSSVTPLRFVAHTDESGAARRRLALRDGVRLAGNLHTLGYFSADVCVGTPPKVFNLIVGACSARPKITTCRHHHNSRRCDLRARADTGSSLMAMPCQGCKQCGQHKAGARFDVQASSTGQTISCNARPDYVRCSSCTASECVTRRLYPSVCLAPQDAHACMHVCVCACVCVCVVCVVCACVCLYFLHLLRCASRTRSLTASCLVMQVRLLGLLR